MKKKWPLISSVLFIVCYLAFNIFPFSDGLSGPQINAILFLLSIPALILSFFIEKGIPRSLLITISILLVLYTTLIIFVAEVIID